ncbi:MAG: hypothetical protein ACE364_00320 [Chlorobiota bacterium]
MLIKKLSLLAFLSLTVFFTSCEDDPVTPSEEHFEAVGYIILNENEEVIFRVFEGQVDNSISESLIINLADGMGEFEVHFLDEGGDDIGTPEGDHDHDHEDGLGVEEEDDDHDHEEGEYSLSIEVQDEGIAIAESHEWEVELTPIAVGTTQMRIQIMHEEHADFTSPFVPLEVK